MNIIQDTSNIKGIILPSNLIIIGNEAFWDCDSLTNISVPDSIINIGVGAFSASGLTSVRIPNSVTGMGDRIFDECIRLTSITFDTGSNIDGTDFGLNAFSVGITVTVVHYVHIAKSWNVSVSYLECTLDHTLNKRFDK